LFNLYPSHKHLFNNNKHSRSFDRRIVPSLICLPPGTIGHITKFNGSRTFRHSSLRAARTTADGRWPSCGQREGLKDTASKCARFIEISDNDLYEPFQTVFHTNCTVQKYWGYPYYTTRAEPLFRTCWSSRLNDTICNYCSRLPERGYREHQKLWWYGQSVITIVFILTKPPPTQKRGSASGAAFTLLRRKPFSTYATTRVDFARSEWPTPKTRARPRGTRGASNRGSTTLLRTAQGVHTAGVRGRGESDKCRVLPLSLPLQTVAVDAASSSQKPPSGPNLILRTDLSVKLHSAGGAHLSRRRRPQDQYARTRRNRADGSKNTFFCQFLDWLVVVCGDYLYAGQRMRLRCRFQACADCGVYRYE